MNSNSGYPSAEVLCLVSIVFVTSTSRHMPPHLAHSDAGPTQGIAWRHDSSKVCRQYASRGSADLETHREDGDVREQVCHGSRDQ